MFVNNFTITIIILLLIVFNGLEQGFRKKRDVNKKPKNYKLYNRLFHLFVSIHVASWFFLVLYLIDHNIEMKYATKFSLIPCFLFIRGFVYDITINLCNLDSNPINYLTTTSWGYELVDKVASNHGTNGTMWFFKTMLFCGSLLFLLLY